MGSRYTVRLVLAFALVGAAGALLTALLINVAFGGLLGGYLDQQQQARQQQIVTLLADSYAKQGSWNTADLDALAPSMMMNGTEVKVEDTSEHTVWDLATSPGGNMMGGIARGGMMGGSALGSARRLPITVAGAVVGTAVVQLPAVGSLPSDAAFRDSVNRMLLLGGLGAGLLAMLLGVFFARRATVPVRELTRTAQLLAAGNRTLRVEHRSDDEFGAMATAFNSMADAVGEEDRLRRTFAADVAHELRTPLMILSSHLEAMEDGVIDVGPGAIASLQDETQRISRLVSDLEVLASADAAHFSLDRREMDLAAEAEAVAAEFSPLFAQKPVTLETSSEPARVNGDPARLRQVVANLLSNALKFTPSGGLVRLSVRRESGHAVLEVADSGPGIPEDEISHVFDRFFRGRGSRTSGSGIGLTVVRELTTAHGGEVTAATAKSGGAVFTVSLPLAAAHVPGGAGIGRPAAAVH
jgi:two-component system, OmpR family, sensor histidine kinase BaeS